ncbi:hypothetical protein ACGFXC_11665 [Streptomyces sp. NPDC048507]|uniref:hypothetical protein n=1 Tax=Streptomyces sp. NPDC048507 TaxID=3365560 RepID=UPI00371ABA4E
MAAAEASYFGVFAFTSIIVWAACVIHLLPSALYSPSRSVALPARLTQSRNACAASPSQPLTWCFFRLSPICLIASAAFDSCVARAFTVSASSEAIIASSCSCV